MERLFELDGREKEEMEDNIFILQERLKVHVQENGGYVDVQWFIEKMQQVDCALDNKKARQSKYSHMQIIFYKWENKFRK